MIHEFNATLSKVYALSLLPRVPALMIHIKNVVQDHYQFDTDTSSVTVSRINSNFKISCVPFAHEEELLTNFWMSICKILDMKIYFYESGFYQLYVSYGF